MTRDGPHRVPGAQDRVVLDPADRPRGVEPVTGRALGRLLLDPRWTSRSTQAGRRLLRHVASVAPRTSATYRLGPVRAAELANRLDRRFGEQPQDADLVVDAPRPPISVTNGAETLVDRAALRQGLRTLPAGSACRCERCSRSRCRTGSNCPARRDAPPRRPAGGALSRQTAVLPVATLAALVTTKPLNGALRGLDVDALRRLLPTSAGSNGSQADAQFVIDGSGVRVVPAPGRKLDADQSRSRSSRTSWLRPSGPVHRQPTLTTEKAQARITGARLGFTTNYPCCAPRVTNIKRAATLLDGTIILPGKAFSLNGALGKRTQAKGFVSARRSSTAGSRMRSAAASARSRRRSSMPHSSPGSSSSPTRRTSSTSRAIRWDARRRSRGAVPS